MVYNLAVEGDESYVVNGLIVHNCRSMLVPVTRFEEVKLNKPVEIERLKELGGGLIFSENQ